MNEKLYIKAGYMNNNGNDKFPEQNKNVKFTNCPFSTRFNS